ncbi:hypothetical protein [Henriciella aquimarina]|uniref:hypothetical protein n=1 Tax=Henriciella aquimarina TaxID=545261 RepID=UPI0009FC01E0|nr:hypothetical protein [Henriciella aquimarina]
MKHLTWMSALLVAGSLSACGQTTAANEPPEAKETPAKPADKDAAGTDDWKASIAGLEGLAEEVFSLEGGLEADLTAINEATPDLISISWDDKSFDAASGATVFSGFKVTFATDPEFGIGADEVEVWGLNSDLIAARLRGERLEESGLAFNRLEARNVSYFGMAGAMNMLFDALEEEIDEEAESDLAEDFELNVDTFESMIGQMVISEVSLRPFDFKPVSDDFFDKTGLSQEEELDADEAEDRQMALDALRLGQQVIAVWRSLSIDTAAAYDTSVRFEMDQPGVNQTADISWDFYGYEDLDGLDIGRAVVVGSRQAQSMRVSDETGELAEAGFEDGISYDQVETTAFMAYEGLKLDKLAGYLARSEFPMMEEKDLISLGTWQARDYALTLNDGEVFEADSVMVDARDFAWLLPEKLTLDMTGAELGAEEVANFAIGFIPEAALEAGSDDEAAPEEGEPSPAEGQEMLDKLRSAVDKLDEFGLSTIPFDTSASWTWDEGTGDSAFSFDMTSEGLGEGATSFDIVLPAYARMQEALEAEDIEAALEDAFQETFAFKGARFFEADEGGYDKLFGYANAIGKLYPQEGWGATLGGMEPAQMRSFLATMIRSGKQVVAQQVPQAADWIESVALYYETSGGSLELVSDPVQPITFEYLESMDSEAEPAEIVEDFGVSVTHTPE